MTELSHRQRLKKNELADLIIQAADWIKDNRTTFFTVVGIIFGTALFSAFFFTSYARTSARTFDKLSMAQGFLSQGQQDQGMNLLDEIIQRYSSSNASFQARLFKADLLISQKKYDEAEKLVLPVTQKGKPRTIIPLAYSILGTIQENAGRLQQAAQTYTTFLNRYPDHFAAPRIYESLARVQELMGSASDARTTYEKLATLYPASPWAQRAQEKIAVLSSAASGGKEAPAAIPFSGTIK